MTEIVSIPEHWMPYPELVADEPGPYEILDSTRVRGLPTSGMADKVNHVIVVPFGPQGRVVSRHELAHVLWSPKRLPRVRGFIGYLQAVEDARINRGLQNLGLGLELDAAQIDEVRGLGRHDLEHGPPGVLAWALRSVGVLRHQRGGAPARAGGGPPAGAPAAGRRQRRAAAARRAGDRARGAASPRRRAAAQRRRRGGLREGAPRRALARPRAARSGTSGAATPRHRAVLPRGRRAPQGSPSAGPRGRRGSRSRRRRRTGGSPGAHAHRDADAPGALRSAPGRARSRPSRLGRGHGAARHSALRLRPARLRLPVEASPGVGAAC